LLQNDATPRRTPSIQDAPISPPAEAERFEDLGLITPLLRAIQAMGHTIPTPIQRRAIPPALAGSDVLGIAQTGTGKTAAFVLPILQRLSRASANGAPRAPRVRALILSPTRELATQTSRAFDAYGAQLGIRNIVVFGGVGAQPQISALRRGIDVVVATPGRLVDLMGQGAVNFDGLEVLVLDEADRMLDEGFLPAIRRIANVLPRQRQTLFFSATMPADIQQIADRMLVKPVKVEVAKIGQTADRIDESVYHVEMHDKRALLGHLLRNSDVTRAIVFTRTKHGADRVVKQLAASDVEAAAIHGNKSQNARERALARFRDGDLRVLVATDLASRGIDVDAISHVINYEMPMDAEGYVHRIGRTARAGARGEAISFCSGEERSRLASIERLIRHRIPVVQTPAHMAPVPSVAHIAHDSHGAHGGHGAAAHLPEPARVSHGGGPRRAPAPQRRRAW
jgi:ATP-dependent RNA helicase RhlE